MCVLYFYNSFFRNSGVLLVIALLVILCVCALHLCLLGNSNVDPMNYGKKRNAGFIGLTHFHLQRNILLSLIVK